MIILKHILFWVLFIGGTTMMFYAFDKMSLITTVWKPETSRMYVDIIIIIVCGLATVSRFITLWGKVFNGS